MTLGRLDVIILLVGMCLLESVVMIAYILSKPKLARQRSYSVSYVSGLHILAHYSITIESQEVLMVVSYGVTKSQIAAHTMYLQSSVPQQIEVLQCLVFSSTTDRSAASHSVVSWISLVCMYIH
jgi:hypothetical protein